MSFTIRISTIILFAQIATAFAQTSANRYEVELFSNPNAEKKDTREVNAVLIFRDDGVTIRSRGSSEGFKDFKYSEIRSAEHSYSKRRLAISPGRSILLSALTGFPVFLPRKEKHWLTIITDTDFAVLKIENDNYRMIRNELAVKKIAVTNLDEDR